MPYPRGEYPFPRPYTCTGQHLSRNVKEVEVPKGQLMIEICADPTCAKLIATCSHRDCTWQQKGMLLTCDFCGVDGT